MKGKLRVIINPQTKAQFGVQNLDYPFKGTDSVLYIKIYALNAAEAP